MRWLLGVLFLLAAFAATADTVQDRNRRQIVVAADGSARFTIDPRNSSLISDEQRVLRDTGQQMPFLPARGVLERWENGAWVPGWRRDLPDDYGPSDALVASGGRFVVTQGWGKTLLAIYRHDGSMVRTVALSEVLPPLYLRHLPRSVTRLHWGQARLREPDKVVLEIAMPRTVQVKPRFSHSEVIIDLATGAVTPPGGPAWDAALDAAQRIEEFERAEAEKERAAFRAPLKPPVGVEMGPWRYYLLEAAARLNRSATLEPKVESYAVPAPGTYSRSTEAFVRDLLLSRTDAVIALAGPADADRFARALVETGPVMAADGIERTNLHVFLAVRKRDIARVRAAFAEVPNVVVFDPAVPIPQRRERLRVLDNPNWRAPRRNMGW